MKFEFSNLEIHLHKRQASFVVVKTVKCKRGNRVLGFPFLYKPYTVLLAELGHKLGHKKNK